MSERDDDAPARSGLFAELNRRNVFRVAAAYVVIGWLTLQVADVVLGFTGAPDWVGKTLIALLLLGFFPALALAWVFEIDRNGLRVDDGQRPTHAAHATRLDMVTLIAVFFVVVLMAWQHLSPAFRGTSSNESAPPRASQPAAGTPDSGASADADAVSQAPRRQRVAEAPLEPEPGSVAVLPFTNRSAEPDTAFFVDGVHDDLLTELSRNSALTVISRTSVMEYRDTTKNLRQIGAELGVAHVLEGAVQRAGQRVRITAQLIDARSDKHLWAETFDRELKPESIFEIQSEIAAAIASALNQKLGLATPLDPANESAPPTRDTAAYDAYLRARITRDQWTEKAIRGRIMLYQQAVDADPQFALAMGELGREHANLFWYITRRDDDRQASRQWIERALALQPDAPQLRLAMAEFHYRAYLDYPRALEELVIAERGLPGSADVAVLRGFIQRRAGRPAETIAALEQAVRMDPRSMSVLATLAETSALLGDLPAADAWTQKLEQLPGLPAGQGRLATAVYRLQLTGDPTAALAELERLRPSMEQEWEASVGDQELQIHQMQQAPDALQAAIERMPVGVIERQMHLRPKSLLRAELAGLRQQPEQVRLHATALLGEAEAVLAAHPEDYRAWMLKALASAMLDQQDAARDAVREALATPIATRDLVLRSEQQVMQMRVLGLLGDVEGLARLIDEYHALPMKYWRIPGLMRLPELHRHRDHPAIQALTAKYAREEAEA
jgi:TolB-like protein/Tfp pilus assembly protein PilF